MMAPTRQSGVLENVPLAPYTTLGIGGPARFLIEARTEGQVIQALDFADGQNLPVFLLGGGSNIVVSDAGFSGLVIRIALAGIEPKENGSVVAAAGEDWDLLVSRCVEAGLAGIECLSGIPGTVGGTPVQNVGAYGQEVSNAIVSVRSLDRHGRKVVELSREECGFGYRTSIFNTTCKERYVVLGARFQLQPSGSSRVVYPDLMRWFSGQTDPPSLAAVRAAVLKIRESKSMVIRPGDPDGRSAGSFFKNPIVPKHGADRIEAAARQRGSLAEGKSMPRYPVSEATVKVPAAWLIEQAGFARGFRRGRVGLSSRHTLALINCGEATAGELLDLMRDIQSAVRAWSGVELSPEPVFVGFA